MKLNQLVLAGAALVIACSRFAPAQTVGSGNIKHVLLLSIDGMHAVDFYNCANGIAGLNAGAPYCPNLAIRFVPRHGGAGFWRHAQVHWTLL
jgi:hypothetical protein